MRGAGTTALGPLATTGWVARAPATAARRGTATPCLVVPAAAPLGAPPFPRRHPALQRAARGARAEERRGGSPPSRLRSSAHAGPGPPSEDAEVLPSGLATRVLALGAAGGERPGPTDVVVVHYTGWTQRDGEQFDTTEGEEPCEFEARAVIPGWTEALQLMTPGEQRRVWIPAGLAYGDAPTGGQPAGALVFDVTLVSFQRSAIKPKMGGFKMSESAASQQFKSPWSFLDKMIP